MDFSRGSWIRYYCFPISIMSNWIIASCVRQSQMFEDMPLTLIMITLSKQFIVIYTF